MPKPSPLASIMMFAGSALLLFALFSASWFAVSFGDDSFRIGLVRAEECFGGGCHSRSIFSGSLGGHGALALLIFLLGFTSVVLAVISGCFLFKPYRSALAIVAFSIACGAMLFGLVHVLVLGKLRISDMSYGFPVFLLGAGGIIAGGIMAMMRPRAPLPMMPMGYRPPMGPPIGLPYGPPMANPYAQPQGNPYAQPPQQNPYAPPPQQSPYAPRPAADAAQAAATGAPCQTCQTPTTWVAQYNRWFCTRCQKYS